MLRLDQWQGQDNPTSALLFRLAGYFHRYIFGKNGELEDPKRHSRTCWRRGSPVLVESFLHAGW